MSFPTAPPSGPMSSSSMKVEDYEKWKAVFDKAAVIRREAGEIAYQLLAYDTDARQVVHFSQWTSLDAARAFSNPRSSSKSGVSLAFGRRSSATSTRSKRGRFDGCMYLSCRSEAPCPSPLG